MLKDVRFLPLAGALRAAPSDKTVVISILDNSKLTARPDFEGFRDVLRLTFLDIYEECCHAPAGSWPSEPSLTQHAQLTALEGERVFALSDALRVVEFAQRHAEASPAVRMLVHCFAGTSRSAAVAAWVSNHFGVPLRDPANSGLRDANPRVLRLLTLAASTRRPA